MESSAFTRRWGGSEPYTVLELCRRAPLSSKDEHLLPPLYSPQVVAIGTDSILMRGIESNSGAGYVQEWHCVIERDMRNACT
jgi:hypothetical protein